MGMLQYTILEILKITAGVFQHITDLQAASITAPLFRQHTNMHSSIFSLRKSSPGLLFSTLTHSPRVTFNHHVLDSAGCKRPACHRTVQQLSLTYKTNSRNKTNVGR